MAGSFVFSLKSHQSASLPTSSRCAKWKVERCLNYMCVEKGTRCKTTWSERRQCFTFVFLQVYIFILIIICMYGDMNIYSKINTAFFQLSLQKKTGLKWKKQGERQTKYIYIYIYIICIYIYI